MKRLLLGSLVFLLCGFGSCQPRKEDDSQLAIVAGQSTMVFSGCQKQIAMGYDVCQLTRGQKLPILELGFVNRAEFAVSDCLGGFYKAGKADKPGTVKVDLSGLQAQAERSGFCMLRLEAKEFYPSLQDATQEKSYVTAGGFIIEFLASGYNPVPSPATVGWCYKIQRTSKGRTLVEPCK